MDSRELEGVRKYFAILRGITLSVQIMPFIYSAIYIVIFILYTTASEQTIAILDTLFYISPLFAICHLVYSKILHLCAWHRTACIVPLIPQAVNFVDYYLVSLSEVEATVFNLTASAMTILLLIAAYNVFFKRYEKPKNLPH